MESPGKLRNAGMERNEEYKITREINK
jgi:hypothetical protein